MNMMSNLFPPPQPELVQYPLPILRTEGLFFLNDSHFCICSSPPSLFLLLSSLLTLPLLPARPLQACCRDGLRDVTEGWSGPLIGAGGGEKWGED